ncbi:PREDICTED: probable E3 ubiquitin-protein ligase RNF144A-B [Camelina sativa]|uniref:RBR-type E3 ubiquitin transferase n=1 Tax=Camelina sativa TaxID=90675 RepID=A0ABM1RS74_CAMSA|nr:PREDICTED: probable E3 ubiquitin-protein ligase RNF144A-B [Camelina sativa]
MNVTTRPVDPTSPPLAYPHWPEAGPAVHFFSVILIFAMQPIKKRFASLFPISVPGNSITHSYKQAKEAIVSELSRFVKNPPYQAKATRKTTCTICLDDDINANQMFCINKCRHRFCYVCMKKHIEVRLRLEGSVIRCPHYRCKSKLTFGSCVHLLTPQLRKIWQQRIIENRIPIIQRIYCPNPRCSALISINEAEVRRRCFECGQLLCIKCKVSWHVDLSCDDYKKLGPNPTADDMLKALANKKLWRQCEKCKHMIELSEGCIKVTCRCGHMFCYKCGKSKAGACCHGIFHMYLPMQP